MFCCPNCFTDKEIIGFIETNSTQVNHCDFCGVQNTSVIPATELYDTFLELFLTYTTSENGESIDQSKFLYEHIKNWGIYNINDDLILSNLTREIGVLLYLEQPYLFDKEVIPRIFKDSKYLQQTNEYVNTWNDLKEEIKHTNRFFLKNDFKFDELKGSLNPFKKSYKKGKLFYRARNSDKNGFEISKMGKPPQIIATAGRANPQGISYLYISNDVKTTLYEVRATLYDYVTVAEFELSNEINILSFREKENISPFIIEDISTYLLYRNVLLLFATDLTKPLRRHDSELDYLPTQYLCEYIKSLGFDGVEYSSSLNPTGFNIALFNDDRIYCKSIRIYEVDSINYEYSELVNFSE
jgi:hypothetical protein